ncbi:MAG: aminotransferase [Pseudomonadota bacterium]
MHIDPFGVEIWMNEWEHNCELNLAETCVYSLTLKQLLELCGQPADALDALKALRLGYGDIPGSERLRTAVAALYATQTAANVLVTHGTIGANALIHQTLVARDEQVVAIVPTYQQHYSIPASIGARVTQLPLRAEQGFLPDLDALEQAVSADTRLIAMTNPNNPTGSLMDDALLAEVVAIARAADAWLLCDEVYRGTNQEGPGAGASIADLYEKGISTGGMSKAFSLAGLRLGWIVAPEPVIEAVMIHRDYNTISVGVIDDHLAALALEHSDALLARSREITRTNLAVLDRWVAAEPLISYVRPAAGTTALLQYELELPSRELCLRLIEETGVMFTPGSAMGVEGTVRIGFGNPTAVLEEGLGRVSAFLQRAVA